MIRTQSLALTVALAAVAPASVPAQATSTKTPTVAELVSQMRARQQAVQSVRLEMVSVGRYPGGLPFEIKGSIRVLGTTHIHISTAATFEDGITAESEMVKTPQGVWIRETDPAYGVTYLQMDRELAERLEHANTLLGDDADAPGALGNMAKDPLGAAMLESLNRTFALEVERRIINGQEFYVVKGDTRGGEGVEPSGTGSAAGTEQPASRGFAVPVPDHIDMLIRRPDLAVVQMVHMSEGRELTRVEVKKMQLDLPMEKGSFRIDLPEGAHFLDVMDHTPAATHIQTVLDDAKAVEAARRVEAKKAPGKH